MLTPDNLNPRGFFNVFRRRLTRIPRQTELKLKLYFFIKKNLSSWWPSMWAKSYEFMAGQVACCPASNECHLFSLPNNSNSFMNLLVYLSFSNFTGRFHKWSGVDCIIMSDLNRKVIQILSHSLIRHLVILTFITLRLNINCHNQFERWCCECWPFIINSWSWRVSAWPHVVNTEGNSFLQQCIFYFTITESYTTYFSMSISVMNSCLQLSSAFLTAWRTSSPRALWSSLLSACVPTRMKGEANAWKITNKLNDKHPGKLKMVKCKTGLDAIKNKDYCEKWTDQHDMICDLRHKSETSWLIP